MTIKYSLTKDKLYDEYINGTYDYFGQYIVNKYASEFDSTVYHESNNGSAYLLILKTILKTQN